MEGYHDLSDAAFERTFERDKDELRSLGVPIEVGSFDPLFDDEPGYRISPAEFELPPIELDADEASVVGVAARVWQHASMAESTRSALAKLRAAGVEPDASQLASLEPSVQATEPAFEPLWTAVLDRARVSFVYRDSARRTLEPWGMTSSKGRWYVIGWDTDRQADADVQAVADHRSAEAGVPPGAYEVPADLDLRALARSLAPAGADPAGAGRRPAGQGSDSAAPRRAGVPARSRCPAASRSSRRLRRPVDDGRGDHPLRRRRHRARAAGAAAMRSRPRCAGSSPRTIGWAVLKRRWR